MSYFTIQHIERARDELLNRGHPALLPILALCRDAAHNIALSATASQTEILNLIFRVEGSETLEWYVPLGAPRGARSEEGRWRGSSKNYVGRSLQVMTKHLRDRGVYTLENNVPRFASGAAGLIASYLGGKTPPTNTPIPAWPFAVWCYRHDSIENFQEAIDRFVSDFGLRLLPGVFDTSAPLEAVAAAPLGGEPVTDEELLSGMLEPRSGVEQTEVADNLLGQAEENEREADEGIATIIGVQLNTEGRLDAGGKPVQLLLHGCPGSGKSFKLDTYSRQANYVFRTVLHPESRYADMVGGLRPRTAWKVEDPSPVFVGLDYAPPGEPRVIYEFVPGPLLQAYYLACFEPDRSVVLIIEELSRGNAAQVFGDFLQLLDRLEESTAGIPSSASVYAIDPRPEVRSWIINNDIIAPNTPRGQVRFPPNLYIWATMNRADQNARQLDSAFLRRWAREHCSWRAADSEWDGVLVRYGGAEITWGTLRRAINLRLASIQGTPEDKFVGPYFIPRGRLRQSDYLLEDLWGYLWYEVLKTRAADFFGVGTFAELADLWNLGAGAVIGQVQQDPP